MYALTIHQPWAALIMRGVKVHEYRNWPPPDSLLGQQFLVHAGRAAPSAEAVEVVARVTGESRDVARAWADALPRGVLLGVVRLLAVEPAPPARPHSPP